MPYQDRGRGGEYRHGSPGPLRCGPVCHLKSSAPQVRCKIGGGPDMLGLPGSPVQHTSAIPTEVTMRSTGRPTRFRTLVLVVFGLSILAGGLGATGAIVYADGEVIIHRGSRSFAADIGMDVEQGDSIETGADGFAIVDLIDGATVKLRENTSLALDTIGERTAVSLETGSLFSRVNRQLVQGFTVNTATAVMGVRGTEFFIAFGRSIDEHPDLWVCVNTGSVDVTVPETEGSLVVEAGDGVNILGGVDLTTPQFYPWTTELNWNMNPSAGEVIDDTDLEQAYADLLDQDYD